MSEVESLLFRLFSEFSIQSPGHKQGFLKVNKLFEMCDRARIFGDKFNRRSLELLLLSIAKRSNAINFESFCSLTTSIAEQKFPQEYLKNPAKVYMSLINTNFLPLIIELANSSTIVRPEDLEIPFECKEVLLSIHEGLRSVYMSRFPLELIDNKSTEEVSNESFSALERTMRAFDIFPTLISKSTLRGLWRDIVIAQNTEFPAALALVPDSQELGKVLTLSKFILLFYLSGQFGYRGTSISASSEVEKLLVLLERVELTRDKTRVEKSLIPNAELVTTILSAHQQSSEEIVLTNPHDLDRFILRIQKIFQAYCAFGDPLNTKALKSNNFQRMLRDSGVLTETRANEVIDVSTCRKSGESLLLNPADADLIFTKLTKGNGMVFGQFHKALALLSAKLNMEVDEFLEEYILRLEEDLDESKAVHSEDLKLMLETLKDDSIVEILSLVHRSILYFYRYYANPRGMMNLNQFLQFCRDFELFPDLVSKTRLTRLFYAMSSINVQDEHLESTVRQTESENAQHETIDEHLFVEALALVSNELTIENNPSLAERICFLVERMNQSKGPVKVLRANGHSRSSSAEIHDLVFLLKDRFPHLLDHSPVQKPSFKDIASQLSLQKASNR